MGGMGFLYHCIGILHVEEYFGDTYCNMLQHITLHFSELRFIVVLLAESESET